MNAFLFSLKGLLFMSIQNDQDLLQQLQKEINQLLDQEELKDLDTFPTEEEIDMLIAVEQDRAFQVVLNRDPLPPVRKFFFTYITDICGTYATLI